MIFQLLAFAVFLSTCTGKSVYLLVYYDHCNRAIMFFSAAPKNLPKEIIRVVRQASNHTFGDPNDPYACSCHPVPSEDGVQKIRCHCRLKADMAAAGGGGGGGAGAAGAE